MKVDTKSVFYFFFWYNLNKEMMICKDDLRERKIDTGQKKKN